MNTNADLAAYEAETAVKAAQVARDAAKRAEAPVKAAEQKEQLRRLQWAHDSQEWVLRRLNPFRNRWPELREIEERIEAIEERKRAQVDELNELRQAVLTAPQEDAQALAAWQLAGADGQRPEPTTPALEAQIRDLELEIAAADAALAEILSEKVEFVERQRGRLVKDADAETDAKRDEIHRLLAQLERARMELISCRRTALWAQLYPHESTTEFPGREGALALGYAKPVARALGTPIQVDAERIFQLIFDDADAIAEARTPSQRAALGEIDPTQRDGIVWANTEEGQQQLNRERRQAREAHERKWGPTGW